MIAARPGYDAFFKIKASNEVPEHIMGMPVVAWADDGIPMILPPEDGSGRGLLRASALSNYVGCGTAWTSEIVSIMPATGWWVERSDPDGSKAYRYRLVGWGLDSSGDVVPLDCDSNGFVMPVAESASFRIFHEDDSQD